MNTEVTGLCNGSRMCCEKVRNLVFTQNLEERVVELGSIFLRVVRYSSLIIIPPNRHILLHVDTYIGIRPTCGQIAELFDKQKPLGYWWNIGRKITFRLCQP
jgi:hypothetical protein